MCISFNRPHLEYAVQVLSGCTKAEIEKPEKVQLFAARIVTGITLISSRNLLYIETGWAPLEVRRNAKLITMFKPPAWHSG
jgi:hypothetical protein